MTQDMDSDTAHSSSIHSPQVPPLTNTHFLLPIPGSKYAPRTLSFKRREHELTHFLEIYDHLCTHFKVFDSKERCKGIVPYCTSKVARMVEKLPSYLSGNFKNLVKDLYYFLARDEDTFSLSKVHSFNKKWRKRRIEAMPEFKRYYRKYLELVGKFVGTRSFPETDFNRYFWEGIHHSLRKRIENRMLILESDLDVTTPFDINLVVEAAGQIFSQKRFDQHLLSNDNYESSDSESDNEGYKPKQTLPESDSENEEEDSDSSLQSRKSLVRRKSSSSEQKAITRKDHHLKKTEEDDVSKLINRMNKLSLGQLSQADSKQKAYLADLLKNIVDPPKNRTYPNQPRPERYPQRDLPPH